jgi:hypothetical protein
MCNKRKSLQYNSHNASVSRPIYEPSIHQNDPDHAKPGPAISIPSLKSLKNAAIKVTPCCSSRGDDAPIPCRVSASEEENRKTSQQVERRRMMQTCKSLDR